MVDWALVVEALKALAWPIVVLVLGWRLHPNIKQLAERVKKLKIGDKEIELSEVPKPPALPPGDAKPAIATAELKQLPEPSDPAPAAEPALVEYAPGGAVVNAWAKLEEVMRRESERVGSGVVPATAGALINQLSILGVIPHELDPVVRELREIRNRVVHAGENPTVAAATQFVATVEEIIAVMEVMSDAIKLQMLKGDLKVKTASEVTVYPLRVYGIGTTEETVQAQMTARRGKWGAAAGGVRMMISERDASLLLKDGATLSRDSWD